MSRYYSNKEILLRLSWSIVEPIFFRYSPRLFYGWRNGILRFFGARIGNHVKVFPSARITYPWLLEIGDRSVISWNVIIYNLGKMCIGTDTVISQHSHLCGGTHNYLSENFELIKSEISIGNHVWLGADVFIGPGVVISDGCVVGARSVVLKNVLSLSVVAGHPAKLIKVLKVRPPMNYSGVAMNQ